MSPRITIRVLLHFASRPPTIGVNRVRRSSTAILLCGVLLTLAVTGCSAWHAVPLTAQPPGGRVLPPLPSDVRVHLVNGGTIELLNAVVDGDSIRGQRANQGLRLGRPPHRPTAIALKDVVLVETSRFHAGKTIAFVLVFGVLILGAIIVDGFLGIED